MSRVPLRTYADDWRAMRSRAPNIGIATLLARLVIWRVCRTCGFRPVIRLHDRSRMRLVAARGDHGVRTAIFLLRHDYEPSVGAAIDRFLAPGDKAYDIGANFGLWTLLMAERVGAHGAVCAFEPAADTLVGLRENVRLSDAENVEICPFALGASSGVADLHIPTDPGSASLARHTGESDDGAVRVLQVQVEPLDAVWRAAGSPPVRLVKIDAEGAEPLVLSGGGTFFAACRPVTCCEINPPRLRALGFDPAFVMDFFLGLNYRCEVWSHAAQALVPRLAGGGGDVVEDVVFVPGEPAGRDASREHSS